MSYSDTSTNLKVN